MDGLPCLLPHWRPASGPGHPTLGILREGPAAAFTHRPPSRCRRRVAPPPTLTLARQTPEPGLCSAPGRLKSVSGSAPGAHLLPAALGLQRPLVHVQGGLHESQASQHLQCLQGGRLGRGNSCDVRGSYYIGCLRVLDEVQYSHLFSAFVLCGSWSSRGWGWCGGPSFTSTGGHPGPADAPAPLSPGTPRLLKRVPHRRASGCQRVRGKVNKYPNCRGGWSRRAPRAAHVRRRARESRKKRGCQKQRFPRKQAELALDFRCGKTAFLRGRGLMHKEDLWFASQCGGVPGG